MLPSALTHRMDAEEGAGESPRLLLCSGGIDGPDEVRSTRFARERTERAESGPVRQKTKKPTAISAGRANQTRAVSTMAMVAKRTESSSGTSPA